MMDHLAKTEFNARLPEGLEIVQAYEAICKGRERIEWNKLDTYDKLTVGVVASVLRQRTSEAKHLDIRRLIGAAGGVILAGQKSEAATRAVK